MHSKAPANAVAVKKEEKEARLKSFISAHLAAAAPDSAPAADRALLLVARSCESPVVAAVQAMHAEIAAQGYAVYAVFAAEHDDARLAPCAATFGWDIRCLADVRYLDAHEQLVLGAETAWIGDCMRREPSKRDAFECYAASCAASATYAIKSFRRIWQAAVPFASVARRAPADAAADCATASMVDQAAGDGPSALTRQ